MPRTDTEARALIKKLGLMPHPEGGYYREIHRSAERVGTNKGRRSALTSIYFLLTRGQRSVFHRVLSDEVWHFYTGAPLRLWRVAADLRSREAILLGPTGATFAVAASGRAHSAQSASGGRLASSREGAVQVAVIPRRDWQAAETLGDYTLVGCSVGPGFDFADFKLLRDDARAAKRMRKVFPDAVGLI
jgi:uncharacterized protein